MKKLIIANWKMNPRTSTESQKMFLDICRKAKNFDGVKTIICPPFIYISDLQKLASKKGGGRVFVGAQNAFYADEGSFTGQISPIILKGNDVGHVIIGHSECRISGETDIDINKKLLRVIGDGMTAVICIGEKERDHGGAYLEFLKNQIKNCLYGLEKKDLRKLVVAYEPVWAIGKSYKEAMSPRDIHETTIYLKKILSDIFGQQLVEKVPMLYGGSVTSDISESIIKDGKVDGFLVGRASLDPDGFCTILKHANDL